MNEENIKIVPNLYEAPSNPALGDVYYNINEDKYYGYNGAQWVVPILEEDLNFSNYILKHGSFFPNLLEITASGTQTINGVTITVNEDKSITLNGTVSESFTFDISTGVDRLRWVSAGYFRFYAKGRIHGLGIETYAGTVLYQFMSAMVAEGVQDTYVQFMGGHDWDRIFLRLSSGVVFNNVTLYLYATSGDGVYEYNIYGTEEEKDWTVEEFFSYDDLSTRVSQLNVTDIEVYNGSLSKPENFLVLSPRTKNNSLDGVAKLKAAILKDGIYSYQEVAKIYPKIIFNKKIVENLVTNSVEQNNMLFNEVLVHTVPQPFWDLTYTTFEDEIITKTFSDYEELKTFLHEDLEDSSVKTVEIKEEVRYNGTSSL